MKATDARLDKRIVLLLGRLPGPVHIDIGATLPCRYYAQRRNMDKSMPMAQHPVYARSGHIVGEIAMKTAVQVARQCVLALLIVPAVASADLTSGCADCHGAGGVSTDPDAPSIASLSAFYIENQFAQFSEAARPCVAEFFAAHEHETDAKDHCEMAKGIAEAGVAEIAAHFSDHAFAAAEQPYDPALAKLGAVIHEQRCDRCHADAGSDPEDDAGILAGQWSAYLRRTLDDYRAGKRWQPDAMAKALEPLDDAAVDALVNYYAASGG